MKVENRKKFLARILIKLLECNISLMSYYHEIATDTSSKRVCSKSIRLSKKAIEEVPHIKHVEILQSLYNTLISGKENVFALSGSLITSKQLQKWDKTEKGFQEFIAIEKEQREKYEQAMKEREENARIIEKAKKEGKKIEMAFIDGKPKPVIIEEKEC